MGCLNPKRIYAPNFIPISGSGRQKSVRKKTRLPSSYSLTTFTPWSSGFPLLCVGRKIRAAYAMAVLDSPACQLPDSVYDGLELCIVTQHYNS